MEAEHIGQITDVTSPKSVSGGKVKNMKKVRLDAKMCVYIKDMECRIPACDMKVCEKCNSGFAYCERVTFIKNMLQRVLAFLICLLLFTEL